MIFNYIQQYENIIWDWNGTLFDDHIAAWEAEKIVFDQLNIPHIDYETRRKIFTMPVEEYYRRINFDFSKMSYEDLCHAWFYHYEKEMEKTSLFRGTEELLKKVVNLGKKQFVLSAAPQDHLNSYFLKLGIRDFFNGVYGLQTKLANCKKDRGRALFEEHKLDPQKTLIIGDMLHDAEVAQELGTSVLLIADGHQDYEILKAATPHVLRSRYDS